MAHWILQSNLWHERGWSDLMRSMDRLGFPYTEVKVIPFIHKIIEAGPEGDLAMLESVENPVVVVGSTALVKAAQKRNWKPGAWHNPDTFKFSIQRELYGKHMFNHDGIVRTLKNVPHRWPQFFIRPNDDTKSFAGEVNTWEEFEIWRQQIQVLGECWGKTTSMDDEVVVAPVREIAAEYRLFVVDKEVVTGSRYKMGSRVIYEPVIDQPVLALAQEAIRRFCPADAFALDIAVDPEGMPYILEVNTINSCGLYAADTMKLAHALNELADKSCM